MNELGDIVAPLLLLFVIANVVVALRLAVGSLRRRITGDADRPDGSQPPSMRLHGIAPAPAPTEMALAGPTPGAALGATADARPEPSADPFPELAPDPDLAPEHEPEPEPELAPWAGSVPAPGVTPAPWTSTGLPDRRDEPPTAPPGRDLLTGLPDADAWFQRLEEEQARVRRYHRVATVVLIELDGLEDLADQLGDDDASRLVIAMADTLRRLARETDVVARLGPGTFGALLPETGGVSATAYVRRVREACEPWLAAGPAPIRLALGWASTSRQIGLFAAERLAADRLQAGSLDTDASEPADEPSAHPGPPAEPRAGRRERAKARDGRKRAGRDR